MGRSVSVPSGAAVVAYAALECEEQWEYDDIKDNLIEALCEAFPSAYESDRYLGNEDVVLVQNKIAFIGLSEYCGLASFWIVPRTDSDQQEALGANWANKVEAKFKKVIADVVGPVYYKQGSFSNGEGVYAKA